MKLNYSKRQIFIVLAIALNTSFISCIDKRENQLTPEDIVIVSGKIKDFNQNFDANSIKVIINDVSNSGQFTHSAKIDTLGNFRISFKHPYAHEVLLSYRKDIPIIISPKDSLYIELNKNNVSFYGKLSRINENFTKYKELYEKKEILKNFDRSEAERDLKEFVIFQDSIRNIQLNLRDSFVENYAPSKDLINWINADIEYSYFRSLLSYPSNHKRTKALPKDWKVDESYYALFRNIPFSKDFLIHSNTYFFVSNYFFGCIWNPTRSQIEKPTIKKIYEKLFDNLDSLTQDQNLYLRQLVTSDLAITWLKEHEMELFGENEKRIRQIVKEPFLIEAINKMVLTKQSLASDLDYIGFSSEKSANLWKKILLKSKDRVVYIKVWTTWCSACRYELPFDERLRSQNKEKPIDFVYLSVDSNKKVWEDLSTKYNMEGNNYFLDEEESSYFKGLLKISGYPTNIIIDKKGSIVVKGNMGSDDPRMQTLLDKLVN
jgi:thiol-disulfide isomerase/thioredoxin